MHGLGLRPRFLWIWLEFAHDARFRAPCQETAIAKPAYWQAHSDASPHPNHPDEQFQGGKFLFLQHGGKSTGTSRCWEPPLRFRQPTFICAAGAGPLKPDWLRGPPPAKYKCELESKLPKRGFYNQGIMQGETRS